MKFIIVDLYNIADLEGSIEVYQPNGDEPLELIERIEAPHKELVDLIFPICEKYDTYKIYAWGLSQYLNNFVEKIDPRIEVIT